MVASFRLRDHRDELKAAKKEIKKELSELLDDEDNYVVVVGRPNTANALKKRLGFVQEVFESQL